MGREIWGELGVWPREWGCTLDSLLGTCLSVGLSGGSSLAGGAAQLSQEKLRVCARKGMMGHPYPRSPLPWEQEAWRPEGRGWEGCLGG